MHPLAIFSSHYVGIPALSSGMFQHEVSEALGVAPSVPPTKSGRNFMHLIVGYGRLQMPYSEKSRWLPLTHPLPMAIVPLRLSTTWRHLGLAEPERR